MSALRISRGGVLLLLTTLLSSRTSHSLDSFECADGSGSIPVADVNDDYCDCFDGSDEPRTGACPNVNFSCPALLASGAGIDTIPSSRVNDGICDCGDGSDELAGPAVCLNMCKAAAAQYVITQ